MTVTTESKASGRQLSPSEISVMAKATGMTPEVLEDILRPPAEGECWWLDGSCVEPVVEGSIWCAEHGAPRMLSGSHPRLEAVA